MAVLSADDLAHYQTQGYVIVRNAVPQDALDGMIAMLDRLVGLDRSTWYKPPHHEGSFVEAYHNQELWNTRQQPRVHEAFSQIHGTHRLMIGVDRASVKLPMHPDHPEYGQRLGMHWDVDPNGDRSGVGTQGVLALTDTTEDMGGFACVPGSHLRVQQILDEQPNMPKAAPDTSAMDVRAIPMKAGDLLIWTIWLLHGSLENRSDRPRLAQYIKMGKAGDFAKYHEAHRKRFEASIDPASATDDRKRACLPTELPTLSPLGRKLAGLDPWD